MKIGIITYLKCDNYSAELQAFALQWKLNSLGFDAEVVNLEKRNIDMKRNPDVILGAIKQRFKNEGFKAFVSIFRKSKETKKKIGDFHRGKVYGEETRTKISKARSKIRHIENIIIKEVKNNDSKRT